MAASKRAIPHFSYVEEIDVTALEETREQLNAHRGERPKLTLLPLLIVAICRALPDFPMLNARYDDEAGVVTRHGAVHRSEEHTSELQSLMRISYAVFCLKKKKNHDNTKQTKRH